MVLPGLAPDAARQITTAISEESVAVLQDLTQQLFAGRLTVAQWEVAAADVIKDSHVAAGVTGAGDVARVSQASYGRMGANLKQEYGYLHEFAQGIENGTVSEAQAMARIAQYGKASEQAYWREAFRDSRPDWANLPVLFTTPRAGATRCYGHCNCTIGEYEDGLHWELHPGESCEDCIALAAGGPYRPGRL